MAQSIFETERQEINYLLNHTDMRVMVAQCIQLAANKKAQEDRKAQSLGQIPGEDWERWRDIHAELVEGEQALEKLAASANTAMEPFRIHNAASRVAGGMEAVVKETSDNSIRRAWAEFADRKIDGATVLDRIETVKEKMVIDELRRELPVFWRKYQQGITLDVTNDRFGVHLKPIDGSRVEIALIEALDHLLKFPQQSEKFLKAELIGGDRNIYEMKTALNQLYMAARHVDPTALALYYQEAASLFTAKISPHVNDLAQCRDYARQGRGYSRTP